MDWSNEQGQDLLYAVLVHTSGINYRSLLAAEARAAKVEDDLIKMADEIETKIKSVFSNVFGTDVEKFTSDWNEIQEAVGQLEKARESQVDKVIIRIFSLFKYKVRPKNKKSTSNKNSYRR